MPAPVLTAGGERLYFSLTTPRLGGDVFVHDINGTRRLTTSPAPVPADRLVSPSLHHAPSFDGERVPFFAFHPPAQGPPPPVVVMVHGGPESQARPIFSAERAALLAAGYGVVVPNVRGSTGYGKRYAALDDTTRRLDSVRDLAAVHGALAGAGFDPERAILWGGSYGGYMVLAGLAFQPELWAAGVDIVGISNLVTFLENTSDYRRAHREREYGSLAHDRAFLTEASPLTHADAIRAPLFVIHGRNDPRVPVGEAEQLVANLTARGVPCTLRIYEDEGHGLARLENQLDAYPAAIAFLDDVVRPRLRSSRPRVHGLAELVALAGAQSATRSCDAWPHVSGPARPGLQSIGRRHSRPRRGCAARTPRQRGRGRGAGRRPRARAAPPARGLRASGGPLPRRRRGVVPAVSRTRPRRWSRSSHRETRRHAGGRSTHQRSPRVAGAPARTSAPAATRHR